MVEVGTRTFAQFMHSAKAQDLSHLYYDAARILEDIWSALVAEATTKMHLLRKTDSEAGKK
jgi:hypothetical protein